MLLRLAFPRSILLFACGSWAIACGDSPAEPDNRLIPISVAFEVSNEDGFVDELGFFNAAKDHFVVGEGSSGDPDGLVYEIAVTNTIDLPVFGMVVSSEVSPHAGILACRELLDQAPGDGANPSAGTIEGGDCAPEGFRWAVGRLDGGNTAVLYFRAEALAEGDDVHRVTVSASGLSSGVRVEEPTLVGGAGPPLSLSVADGHIDAGIFDSSIDPHLEGDGGASAPNALVYAIGVVNQGAFAATGVEVSARIPQTAPGLALACREILSAAPHGGDNPTIGSAACTSEGLSWTIGRVEGGEAAQLFARVEARLSGNHVTRVTLRADVLSHEVVREELTTVLPPTSP
ncbi:MAG: hypothetical protein ACREMK_10470 [Gemmatimonadota bacterium]